MRAGKTRVAADRQGCRRVIPPDWLFTGKDLTVPIEQDSTVRHDLARFRRQTMADLSLRLLRHLQDPAIYASHAKPTISIFG